MTWLKEWVIYPAVAVVCAAAMALLIGGVAVGVGAQLFN